jgi:hypothetical protein
MRFVAMPVEYFYLFLHLPIVTVYLYFVYQMESNTQGYFLRNEKIGIICPRRREFINEQNVAALADTGVR